MTMHPNPHDYAAYPKRAGSSTIAAAAPAAVWAVVAAIGGDNRYYSLNTLWTIRETLDWLAGGRGLARGRRHPTQVQTGDRIDAWEVIAADPERRLALAFGLRAPGAGVLEFLLDPLPGARTRLTATAYWQPDGLPGHLYWLAMEPFHQVIFAGMVREIGRRAEAGFLAPTLERGSQMKPDAR